MNPPPRQPDLAKLAARMQGMKYFWGSQCKYGHDGMRYTSTGQCKTCVKIHNNNRNY